MGKVVDTRNIVGNRLNKLTRKQKVLAVSSGGGHWIQLLRLRPILEHYETVYSTVDQHYKTTLNDEPFTTIRDSSFSNLSSIIPSALSALKLVLKIRPDLIISTGAAPGALALAIGKLMGITTVWIDSIANSRRISASGKMVRFFSDLRFSQWPKVAKKENCSYIGNLL